jgi:hypothetical protein
MEQGQTQDNSAVSAEDASAPAYAYKPSLMGAPWEFRLQADRLVWSVGSRSGVILYRDIRRVRLSFRPATMQSYRFMTEIWSQGAPKLTIISTSWRGLTEQERLDRPYRDFILALHRHIAAANANPVLEAGTNPLLYWPGAAIVAALALCVVWLMLRALVQDSWPAVLFLLGFLALLVWQIGGFFGRNRPLRYEAGAVPERVLPKPRA